MSMVVVYDLTGEFMPGELVDGQAAAVLQTRRSILLMPVDDTRFHTTLSGWCRRDWGRGWAFDGMTQERGCPLAAMADAGREAVFWAAGVAPIRPGKPWAGHLRMVGDGSLGLATAGLSQDVIAPRFEELPPGTLAIGGRNRLARTGTMAPIGLSLYGAADNVRVLWSCVSLLPAGWS
jgi:hypothetical protein